MNNQINATIIADSVNNNNNRITTFEIEFHRFILPELLTHRLFSRNTSSSRAIPVLTQIKQVWNNPATPIYWGCNQAGMQANSELTGISKWFARTLWNTASKFAAILAYLTAKAKLHKQITNRILEPFVLVKMVLTATEFDNFFYLRCHKDAQPEIKELADKMYTQYHKSNPTPLEIGEWHLPYIRRMPNFDLGILEYWAFNYETKLSLEDAKLISASACAQVSYRALDMTLDKAKLIYNRLITSAPPHASPMEHQATPMEQPTQNIYEGKVHIEDGITHIDTSANAWSGNLKGWIQLRHLIPNNTCHTYIQND